MEDDQLEEVVQLHASSLEDHLQGLVLLKELLLDLDEAPISARRLLQLDEERRGEQDEDPLELEQRSGMRWEGERTRAASCW